MSEVKFRSKEHRDFFLERMDKCKTNDSYHRAFFYVMGIAGETRKNINQTFVIISISACPVSPWVAFKSSWLSFNL